MDDIGSGIILGNMEMLKALYDFKATFAKTLSFREKDMFLLYQTNAKQRNWWQVINEKGQIGFVPSNYVKELVVTPDTMLRFIDDCIKNIHIKLKHDDNNKDLLCRLKEKRRHVELTIRKEEMNAMVLQSPKSEISSIPDSPTTIDQPMRIDSPPIEIDAFNTLILASERKVQLPDLRLSPLSLNKNTDSISTFTNNIDTFDDNTTPCTSREIIQVVTEKPLIQSSRCDCTPCTPKSLASSPECTIKPQDVYDIVEHVRKDTKLSHEMSRVAVQAVISQLQGFLPKSVAPHLSKILHYSQTELAVGDRIENTQDYQRIKVIFSELTYCKEDSQQRSWMLHEDEYTISEFISELISILSNADPNVCKRVIASDQYHAIFMLIQYYQMEARWSIRQLLLQSFGVLCSFDKTVVNIMLNSVLPMELARDMRQNPTNLAKLNYSSLLLTMIFSMGEQMPVTHCEQLGYEFMVFIFDYIEHPPAVDVEEQIPDLFINFVLSFNLQFGSYTFDNFLLRALENQPTATVFTEKLLLMLNREEDPIRVFDHEPAPPHSLIKLFIDVFGKKSTAMLFYTNDIKVLIDIIIRQLSDLSPSERRRKQYLELCKRVIRNTNYDEHRHKYQEISKCFQNILHEESESSKHDQLIVRDIIREFPEYFRA